MTCISASGSSALVSADLAHLRPAVEAETRRTGSGDPPAAQTEAVPVAAELRVARRQEGPAVDSTAAMGLLTAGPPTAGRCTRSGREALDDAVWKGH